MKRRGIESEHIGWLPPATLSQSGLKSENNILVGKEFDPLQGRRDFDQCATTKEKPVRVKRANNIQERSRDDFDHPLS
jgi:hypothetical protein